MKQLKKIINNPIYTFILFLIIFGSYEFYFKHDDLDDITSNEIRVIDGDTITLENIKIRLKGIDAPELKQYCQKLINNKLKRYPCGKEATEHLKDIIGYQSVTCTDEGKDRYNRKLSYCHINGLNINQQMVRDGHAIAYRAYDKRFIKDEEEAKQSKKGLWAGKFEEPAKWRAKKKQHNKGRSK